MRKKIVFLVAFFVLFTFSVSMANPLAWISLVFGVFQCLRPSEKVNTQNVAIFSVSFYSKKLGQSNIMNVADKEISAWINSEALKEYPDMEMIVSGDMSMIFDADAPTERFQVAINGSSANPMLCKDIDTESLSGWTVKFNLLDVLRTVSADHQRSCVVRVMIISKEDAVARGFFYLNFEGNDFIGSQGYEAQKKIYGDPVAIYGEQKSNVVQLFSNENCYFRIITSKGEKLLGECNKIYVLDYSKIGTTFVIQKVQVQNGLVLPIGSEIKFDGSQKEVNLDE
ncbi:MAG: hypothetical protein ACOZAR_05235 [Patescibacteria group bacterium]